MAPNKGRMDGSGPDIQGMVVQWPPSERAKLEDWAGHYEETLIR